MAVTLISNINELDGVGDFYTKKLEKLGIHTIRDLLFYFPRRWDDFSKITPISNIKVGEAVSVRGVIWDIATKKSRKGKPFTEAIITDDTGTCKAVWFNQPWLEKSLKKDDEIFLAGTLEFSFSGASFVSPVFEKVHEEGTIEDLRHVGKIIPVYSETEGLTSKWLRQKIAGLAKLVYGIKDYLPEEVKTKLDLIELSSAIRTMHYPENFEELKMAQKRMFYDDLFCLFCAVLSNKVESGRFKSISIDYDEVIGKKFVESLPYTLTNSQRKSAWEILKDISKPTPMNRLLEGDVGSGKTVVSAMSALMVAKKGYQVAILAPTEILARQHYESFKKLLDKFEIKIDLLVGNIKSPDKKNILKNISDSETQIIIGTHTILSPDVKFWTLGLVIIDEQHRFGVEQREKLKSVNENNIIPHFLSMSATPIPRTLAITVFGDLEISTLTEMPKGREKISTFLIPPEKRKDGYKFIDEQIEKGRQIFVICPLISASDKLGVKSAEEEAERLSKSTFKHRRVGLIHGRLKSDEKDKIMKDFKNKKIDILVSTSVIEVGIDVPNANIMLIEGAERFGLAQLHQFRGRVGRGTHKSYCFLFTDSDSETTLARLDALLNSEDGFELAERDLEIRGPGELLGIKQSGKIDETLISAIKNPDSINKIRKVAEEYLLKNNLLDNSQLYEKVKEFNIAAKLE